MNTNYTSHSTDYLVALRDALVGLMMAPLPDSAWRVVRSKHRLVDVALAGRWAASAAGLACNAWDINPDRHDVIERRTIECPCCRDDRAQVLRYRPIDNAQQWLCECGAWLPR